MAANRFATMVHRKTNKITLILVYAVLEWVLIALLLLNSLFSYLIIKFAEFFGLKPPCLWCTRIDHFFDPAKTGKNTHRDLLCEVHRKEVSRLGYCSSHRKLVESRGMCEDCLSSQPEFHGSSKNFAVLQNGGERVGENGGVSLDCSCCGVRLDDGRYSSYALLKTSSCDALERAQKENLITFGDDDDRVEEGGDDGSSEKVLDSVGDEKVEIDGNLEVDTNDKTEEGFVCENSDESKLLDVEKEKEIVEEEKSVLITKDKSVQVCFEEDVEVEIPPQQHLEFFLDFSGQTLVPIELIDSMTESKENDEKKDEDFVIDSEVGIEEREALVVESGSRVEKTDAFLDVDINEEPSYSMLEAMEMEEDENSLVFHAKDSHFARRDEYEAFPLARWPSLEASEAEEKAASLMEEHSDDGAGLRKVEEQMVELQSLSVQDREHMREKELEVEVNGIEEDKFPDTPKSMESLNQLHKKLLMLEKNDSWTEESLDGSVTSELEGSDGVVTVERLKTALRAERKTLQALYMELEEERSASAVAANQTMAMINRLQEEKAAMQMEALQYQRMMEEQSEYDQEALQLLNELMVKREKEKQELERELEGYRKKLSAALLALSDSSKLDFSHQGWQAFGESELDLVNKWAFEGEKIIHGRPSGIDNTVSTYGNMIKFRSGELTCIKTNMPVKMLITNTNVGRNTKALVAGVSDRTTRHGSAMASVFNAVDSISNEVAAIIQSPVSDDLAITEKEEKLGELMEMNQGILQCMGVSHASIETVIRTTLKYKLPTKLTGAGGGGCVLTLLPTLLAGTVVDKVIAELEECGFQCLIAGIGGRGMEVSFSGSS